MNFMVPKKFGHREIWSQRNLGPKNVGPKNVGSCMKMPYNFKFLGPQISTDQNFSETKFLGAQMRSGPIQLQPTKILDFNFQQFFIEKSQFD